MILIAGFSMLTIWLFIVVVVMPAFTAVEVVFVAMEYFYIIVVMNVAINFNLGVISGILIIPNLIFIIVIAIVVYVFNFFVTIIVTIIFHLFNFTIIVSPFNVFFIIFITIIVSLFNVFVNILFFSF